MGNGGGERSFLDRLRLLAGTRKLSPWLSSLGWSKGDVDRVMRLGHIPGPEKLAALATSERVNLSWLLAEIGDPWIGESASHVREMAALYYLLSPKKQELVKQLIELDDKAVDNVSNLLAALKRGGYYDD